MTKRTALFIIAIGILFLVLTLVFKIESPNKGIAELLSNTHTSPK